MLGRFGGFQGSVSGTQGKPDEVSTGPRPLPLPLSAPGLQSAGQRQHKPHKVCLPRQAVLGEHVLHMRADRALLAARRRGDLADVHAFGQQHHHPALCPLRSLRRRTPCCCRARRELRRSVRRRSTSGHDRAPPRATRPRCARTPPVRSSPRLRLATLGLRLWACSSHQLRGPSRVGRWREPCRQSHVWPFGFDVDARVSRYRVDDRLPRQRNVESRPSR